MKHLASTVGLNVAVGITYIVFAALSYLLVLPPDEFSVIWPATGIGVGAVLIYGRTIYPGLLVGLIASHSVFFFDSSNITTLFSSIAIVVVVCGSRFLQIEVTYFLIKKYVGLDNKLIDVRDTVRFFVIAGPVGSALSATTGVLGAVILGYFPEDRAADYWLVWWASNSLGVLVLLPILMVLFARPRINWTVRAWVVGLPLILCFMLLVYNLYDATKYEKQRLLDNLAKEVDVMHRSIEQSFVTKEQAIWTISQLVITGVDIHSDPFRSSVEEVAAEFEGITIVSLFEKVLHADRERLEQEVIKAPFVGFSVKEQKWQRAPVADVYFPTVFSVEVDAVSSPTLGADLLSVERGRHILKPLFTKKIPLSLGLDLFSEGKKYGSILLHPFVDETGEVNRVAVITYSIDELVAATLANLPKPSVDIEIIETGETRYSNKSAAVFGYGEPYWTLSRAITTLGNEWIIEYTANDVFRQDNVDESIWSVVLIATAFAAFIGITLFIIAGQFVGRDEIVQQRTLQLRNEVHKRNKANKQQLLRNDILQLIAESKSLDEVFDQIMALFDQYQEGIAVALYMLSADRKNLQLAAANNLPENVTDSLAEIVVDEPEINIGFCALLQELTLVEDINQDEGWKHKRTVFAGSELNSCLAIPIQTSDQQLSGVFAFFLPEDENLSDSDIDWITKVADLVSIAIEKKQAEDEIEHLAYYDALTELPNRRLLRVNLLNETYNAVVQQSYGAVLFIDLDHFKTLNDSLGHHYGDELLSQISQRLQDSLGDNLLARWGGDEFVLLLTAESHFMDDLINFAMEEAQKIQTVLSLPFDLDGYVHSITCSIGIAPFHGDNSNVDDILKQADAAMYHAKEQGRNRISVHHEDMQSSADNRLMIENGLREALSSGGFSLVYQPQFDHNNEMIGAEALIRWPEALSADISTDQFIFIAEQSDLIIDIGKWLIDKICHTLAQWPDLTSISVNISPKHFMTEEFIALVKDSLASYEVDGSRLVVELTEKTMLGNVGETIEHMESLKALNVKMSIDDFGVGYSSLAYLTKLPIDQLKIDQSFVHSINSESEEVAVVDTIISLAQSLELELIAEGVETEQQLNYLMQRKCCGYQGYYFSYPLTEHELADKLAAAQN